MNFNIELRNASLETLVEKLRELETRIFDVVVSPGNLKMVNGQLTFEMSGSLSSVLQGIGVTTSNEKAAYKFTLNDVSTSQICEKLGIPKKYYDRMSDAIPHLFDINVNEWLKHADEADKVRNFLLRSYLTDETDTDGNILGIARAFLSDRYKIIDNFDVLKVAMKNVRDYAERSGYEITVERCDLSERNMYVSLICPDIEERTKDLLLNYTDPESGNSGIDTDFGISTGLVFSNSETGFGKMWVAPRLMVGACRNGMVFNETKFGRTHLGAKAGAGIVNWSEETEKKNFALIKSQLNDAFEQFLSPEFLGQKIEKLRELGSYQLKHPQEVVKSSCKHIGMSEKETDDVFNYFLKQGSTRSAFDVVQSITTYAQHKTSTPERQFELEGAAVSVLERVQSFDIAQN